MLVDYVFAKGEEWGEGGTPMPEGLMYRYVVGANGVFVQAKREGLEACLWSSALVEPIRGLAKVMPYVRLGAGKVAARLVEHLFSIARQEAPKEALFYFLRQKGLLECFGAWTLHMPKQVQEPGGVWDALEVELEVLSDHGECEGE